MRTARQRSDDPLAQHRKDRTSAREKSQQCYLSNRNTGSAAQKHADDLSRDYYHHPECTVGVFSAPVDLDLTSKKDWDVFNKYRRAAELALQTKLCEQRLAQDEARASKDKQDARELLKLQILDLQARMGVESPSIVLSASPPPSIPGPSASPSPSPRFGRQGLALSPVAEVLAASAHDAQQHDLLHGVLLPLLSAQSCDEFRGAIGRASARIGRPWFGGPAHEFLARWQAREDSVVELRARVAALEQRPAVGQPPATAGEKKKSKKGAVRRLPSAADENVAPGPAAWQPSPRRGASNMPPHGVDVEPSPWQPSPPVALRPSAASNVSLCGAAPTGGGWLGGPPLPNPGRAAAMARPAPRRSM